MDSIRVWAVTIICAAVVCTLAQTVVPTEKRKIMGFVLGLFMLTVMTGPAKKIAHDFKNLDCVFDGIKSPQTSKEMVDFSNDLTIEKGSLAVKEIIEEKLTDFGVQWNDIEVICKFCERENGIIIELVSIQLDKSYSHRKVQIEKYIKDQTGLFAQVILI